MNRILMTALLGTALAGVPVLTGCEKDTADQPRSVEQKTVEKTEDGRKVETHTKTEKQPDGATVETKTEEVKK